MPSTRLSSLEGGRGVQLPAPDRIYHTQRILAEQGLRLLRTLEELAVEEKLIECSAVPHDALLRGWRSREVVDRTRLATRSKTEGIRRANSASVRRRTRSPRNAGCCPTQWPITCQPAYEADE